MDSIVNTLNKVANTVMEAVNPAPTSISDLTKRQIIGLEESERAYRLAHPSATQVSRRNAAQVSSFIKSTPFPFVGLISRNAGLKRMTTRLEDHERERRITSRTEFALRKSNANRTADMIRSLGWPFYNHGMSKGPIYSFADPTSIAEEQERQVRINNPLQAQISRSNASFVANAIRWAAPTRSQLSQAGSQRYTRSLQEKERTRLLNDQEGIYDSVQNAYNVAALIRHLGWPFYVQSKNIQTSGQDIASIERQEQERRIHDQAEQRLAREHANRVSRLIPRAEIILPATRSIPQQAREQPISLVKEEIIDLSGLFKEPVNDINSAYENERTRRSRDTLGEAFRRQGASRIAGIINAARPAHAVSATPSPKTRRSARRQSRAPGVGAQLSPIEEERQARMHDWQLQQIQMRNARFVSRILRENGFPKAQPFVQRSEERERFRRMVDLSQMETDKENAHKVSNLIKDHFNRPAAPAPAMPAPVMRNEFRSAPILREPSVLSVTPLIIPGAAVTNAPALLRTSSFTRSAGGRPVLNRSLTAPSLQAPVSQSAAPVSQMPYIPAGTNTYYSAAGSHVLSAAQLRRLQRQAMKENKIANKESRKAAKTAGKAQKLQLRGKSAKASKIDAKTQEHLLNARTHHTAATDLLMKQRSASALNNYTSAPIGLASM